MRKNFYPFWVALLFASLSASFSFATTFTWTNTAGGNWTNPANWIPAGPPTAVDTALITNNGTYTVTNTSANVANVLTLGGTAGTQTLLLSAGSLTLGSAGTGSAQAVLNVTGGTLGGVGSLVLAGPMNWGGGSISNSVQFNGGAFSNALTLNFGQIINTGTLNWTATGINTGNGSLISNAPAGIINLTVNLGEGSFGGTRTFANAGQLNVTAPGTATISEVFNNSGTVAVNGGTLNVQGGGTETGSFTSASGATNDFGAGTFAMNTGASISGPGTWLNSGAIANFTGNSALTTAFVNISSGTVLFDNSSTLNFPVLNMNGGALTGTNPVTATTFNWSAGQITTNLVQFNGGTFSSGLSLNNGGQVINTGILTWTAASINTGNGSLISNAPSGIINLTANLGEGSFGGTHTFNNAGQLNVTVSGTATIGSTFNNTGSVTLNGGTLDFQGGGTGGGSFTAVSGATLGFTGGTFSITSGAISGAGNFSVGGAIITVGVALNLSGTWTFTSSTAITLSGTTTVSGNAIILSGGNLYLVGPGPWRPATLTMSGGSLAGTSPVIVQNPGGMSWSAGGISTNVVQFAGGTFSSGLSINNGGEVINTGTLNWTATSMNTGNGSIISNAPTGIINLTANLSEGNFGGSRSFNNAGQFNVTIPGTANFGDSFNNTGTVAINSGTLILSGGGTETSAFTIASGATNEFSSASFAVNSGASISGAGTWVNAGGSTANFTGTSSLTTAAVSIIGGTVIFNNSTSLNFPVLNFSNGTLEGNNPVMVSGPFTWTGGSIVTNLVQFNGGAFSNTMFLNDGGEIINTGTLNWAATTMDDGNGSIISNAPTGTINLITNFSQGNLGGTRTFNNGGQLNVAVSGTANISDAFNNGGTITFNNGILNLSGTHNLAGGTLNFGINALNNYGSNILAGAAGLAGSLKSVFNGSYLPSVGNTYNIMTYGSSSGNFTATNLSPVAVWQVNQNSAALSITVLKLVPQVAWATPFDMFYGNPLDGSRLNASATWNGTNVPGVFNYTPLSGTVPNSGSNQVLSVNFVPNDPSTFISVTTNVLVNVQKSPLVITATNITKTYGQTITFTGTEFTTGGLVNGDFVTSATLSSVGAPPTAGVSGFPYIINITNAVGDAGLTNYNIIYSNGQLTVNNANLVITANNTNKIVGETLTFAGTEFTVSGLQNGETIGTVTLTSAGAAAGAGAGSYSIVPGTPINGGTFSQLNYFDTFNNGTLTVLGAPSLAIALNGTGTQDILTFPAILGQQYQVQATTNLATAMTPLGAAISHTNGTVNVTNNLSAPQTFYRLQMQLGP